jgi:hypothetical protein
MAPHCKTCDGLAQRSRRERQRLEISAERELQVALALTRGATAFSEYFAESGKIRRVQANVGCPIATAIGAPIGVVPNVVGLGAELEASFLGNGEGLEKAEVPVLKSRLIDDVAHTLSVERSGCGGPENPLIDAVEFRTAVRAR